MDVNQLAIVFNTPACIIAVVGVVFCTPFCLVACLIAHHEMCAMRYRNEIVRELLADGKSVADIRDITNIIWTKAPPAA